MIWMVPGACALPPRQRHGRRGSGKIPVTRELVESLHPGLVERMTDALIENGMPESHVVTVEFGTQAFSRYVPDPPRSQRVPRTKSKHAGQRVDKWRKR